MDPIDFFTKKVGEKLAYVTGIFILYNICLTATGRHPVLATVDCSYIIVTSSRDDELKYDYSMTPAWLNSLTR